MQIAIGNAIVTGAEASFSGDQIMNQIAIAEKCLINFILDNNISIKDAVVQCELEKALENISKTDLATLTPELILQILASIDYEKKMSENYEKKTLESMMLDDFMVNTGGEKLAGPGAAIITIFFSLIILVSIGKMNQEIVQWAIDISNYRENKSKSEEPEGATELQKDSDQRFL